ncbi:MAG: hypothetical protein NTZ60_01605 [Campylobacterales bacterium]|nr:hypothetical protein [Campylobacterales bacterium]
MILFTFTKAKPVRLIKTLIKSVTHTKKETILVYKNGYKNIYEVMKERVRLACGNYGE